YARHTGALDLAVDVRVPPDVVDVDGDAEAAPALRIEPIADVERLPERVHAGAVGGVHWMKRFDGERHTGRICPVEKRGDGVLHLGAGGGDVLRWRRARPRELRQPAYHQHQAGRAELGGLL